jgi:hypothetical protein
MSSRIRVTTKASCFEERKEQHARVGYRIEDEQPFPVNGLCSFVAVKEDAPADPFDDWFGRERKSEKRNAKSVS